MPTGSTLEASWVNSKVLNLSIWESTSYLETGKPLRPGTHSSWFPSEKKLPIQKCLRDSTGFPGGASGKEPACQCRRHKVRQVWSLGWEDPLEEGFGNSFQYSCLENPMDRGAWRATVHGIAKSRTWLKQLNAHTRRDNTHHHYKLDWTFDSLVAQHLLFLPNNHSNFLWEIIWQLLCTVSVDRNTSSNLFSTS